MKKEISISAILLFLLLFIGIFFYQDINNMSVAVNTLQMNLKQESDNSDKEKQEAGRQSADGESTGQLQAEKENQLLQAKQKLSERLTTVDAYLLQKNSTKTTVEFLDWLQGQYGADVLIELSNGSTAYINRDFYTHTGKSLFILLDEFLELKDYESRESSQYGVANLTFAGDICLAEDGFVLDYYDTTTGLKDCIDENIINIANDADIFMINNEFCFSERGEALAGKLYTFRAMPNRVGILQELGTDIVSLANNHVYDFGAEAFSDTIQVLEESKIQHVGGGANVEEAEKVIYYDVNGIKIGIVSASSAEKVRYTPQAGETTPGIFRMYDTTRLLEVVAEADKQCDYLIAYLHWGTEDSKYFEAYQQELAANLVNTGVDAIIGGHPHVLQGMEYVNGKPVVYSLGDFWFNSETKYTAMVSLTVDINGIRELKVIPCMQKDFTTTLLSVEEQAGFYSYLSELSPGCSIDANGIVTDLQGD